jgi:peroxiredoxin
MIRMGGVQMAQTELQVGAQAPDFTLPDENGRPWRLSDAVRRSPQVLLFYRGDW